MTFRQKPEQEIRLIEKSDRRHALRFGGRANAREVHVRRRDPVRRDRGASSGTGARPAAASGPGASVLREGRQRAARVARGVQLARLVAVVDEDR